MVSKAKSSNASAYIRPEGLRFLRGLERNNDRDWFNERKGIYETQLKEPMLAIIRKITDAMMDFAPHHGTARGEELVSHLSRHALQQQQAALQDA